jgi:glucose-1-phosphate cytidylyltransferase
LNILDLVAFHRSHGKLATVTACQPAGRFGTMEVSERNEVISFREKPRGDGAWISGGFFVFQPAVFDYLEDDKTVLEREPLETLARKGELAAYKHTGFWQPMDTQRDKTYLEELWEKGSPPWKVW